MAGNINTAFNLIVQACNDPYIGYSQTARTTIKLNQTYYTYADCSSLISWAMTNSGFFTSNPWFWTGNQAYYLKQVGFTELDPKKTNWKAGDILLNHNDYSQHTEMVYQSSGTGGRTMGAHTDGIPFPDQVSINSYVSSGSSWQYLFRYEEGASGETDPIWHQNNTNAYNSLTDEEYYDNAIMLYYGLLHRGFSPQAAAGIMGSAQSEGLMNPAQWQHGFIVDDWNQPLCGYGIFQLTPCQKYKTFYESKGIASLSNASVNANCQLDYVNEVTGQFNAAGAGMTFDEFKQLTDVSTAARIWFQYWEFYSGGGSSTEETKRTKQALKWWNEITTNFPRDPGNPVPTFAEFWRWFPAIYQNKRNHKRLT